MGKYCCVVSCKSNFSDVKRPGAHALSFFTIPTDPNRRKKLILAVRRDPKNFVVSQSTYVCSLHFEAGAFYSGKRR